MAGIDKWYNKPWMSPVQYTDGGAGRDGEPDRERTPEEIDSLIEGRRERDSRHAGRGPSGVSTDTEPMVYRNGDRDAELDIDDHDELGIVEDYKPVAQHNRYVEGEQRPLQPGEVWAAPPDYTTPQHLKTPSPAVAPPIPIPNAPEYKPAPPLPPETPPYPPVPNRTIAPVVPSYQVDASDVVSKTQNLCPSPEKLAAVEESATYVLTNIGRPFINGGNQVTIAFGNGWTHTMSVEGWLQFIRYTRESLSIASTVQF